MPQYGITKADQPNENKRTKKGKIPSWFVTLRLRVLKGTAKPRRAIPEPIKPKLATEVECYANNHWLESKTNESDYPEQPHPEESQMAVA